MIKQSLEIPCDCGDKKCTRSMNIHEDEENKGLTILTVKTDDVLRPAFFSLNRETALALVKWLISRYKLRNDLDGKSEETVIVSKPTKQPSLFADAVSTEDDKIENTSEQAEPVIEKRKRGRPKKNTEAK